MQRATAVNTVSNTTQSFTHGEKACESYYWHGGQCTALGCCLFEHGECVSGVGDGICTQVNRSASSQNVNEVIDNFLANLFSSNTNSTPRRLRSRIDDFLANLFGSGGTTNSTLRRLRRSAYIKPGY